MKPGQPFAEGSSVINHWLITATAGRNCHAARSAALAIGPLPILYTLCRESRLPGLYVMFPNWNALRSELNWTLPPVADHIDKGDRMVSHASEFNRADRNWHSDATDKESLSVQTQGKSTV